MRHDEAQTSEIREKVPGFDRRDRTVRGTAQTSCQHPGSRVRVSIDGFEYDGLLMYAAGEAIEGGDLVELENGLWWRA